MTSWNLMKQVCIDDTLTQGETADLNLIYCFLDSREFESLPKHYYYRCYRPRESFRGDGGLGMGGEILLTNFRLAVGSVDWQWPDRLPHFATKTTSALPCRFREMRPSGSAAIS